MAKTLDNNSLEQWVIAACVAVGSVVILRLAQALVTQRLRGLARKTSTHWDDALIAAVCRTRLWFLLVVGVFFGARLLELSSDAHDLLRTAVVLTSLLQGGIWMSAAFRGWLELYREEELDDDAGGVMTMNAVGMVARIALWATILLLALDNVGVDVTALVAGLGVGGVAVALALQNILGDLFSSLSIALDKPFVIGDFVIVDELMGTIEHIGIKTTRVRSLSGEQLVFSNGDLISTRIRNYGRMEERRVSFELGVVYGTAKRDLEEIPNIVREAIEGQAQTRFDRSHFSGYGDFSLDFESVYYVLGADYNLYMDIQEAIYLRIYEAFEERGIHFAFPTQSILIERSAKLPVVQLSRESERKSA